MLSPEAPPRVQGTGYRPPLSPQASTPAGLAKTRAAEPSAALPSQANAASEVPVSASAMTHARAHAAAEATARVQAPEMAEEMAIVTPARRWQSGRGDGNLAEEMAIVTPAKAVDAWHASRA